MKPSLNLEVNRIYIGLSPNALRRLKLASVPTFPPQDCSLGLAAYVYLGGYTWRHGTNHSLREVSPDGFIGEEWVIPEADMWLLHLKPALEGNGSDRLNPYVIRYLISSGKHSYQFRIQYDAKGAYGWILSAAIAKIPNDTQTAYHTKDVAGVTYLEALGLLRAYIEGWEDHARECTPEALENQEATAKAVETVDRLEAHLGLAMGALAKIRQALS